MFSFKKNTYSFAYILISCLLLLILQVVWMCKAYQLERQQLVLYIENAIEVAYQKEQTYRVPVVDIVNPGAVTIESCGTEEVYIIRKCPEPDTIVYNNLSGRSIDQFINRVFGDLREQIVPMNIYCMADLFAGLLHDADIPAVFVIERFNIDTEELLETSSLPDKKQPDLRQSEVVNLMISDTESLRGIVQLTPGIVLGRMSMTLVSTVFLLFLIISLLFLRYIPQAKKQNITSGELEKLPELTQHPTFQIGQFTFDPGKNELTGFDESIQLNKKENAILYALCLQHGNVVERHTLLQENWGSSGAIYSRSLDTYLATLRKYLKKDSSIQIVTVKGVGYKLVY